MESGYTIKELKKVMLFCKTKPDGIINVPAKITGSYEEKFNSTTWRKWFKKCLHEKINRNMKTYGRKDDADWRCEMNQAKRQLNSNVYIDWLPSELMKRFSYRLRCNCEDDF